MDHDPVIICKGLTRRFGEIVAVDRLDMSVRRGEVFGFLGHNGAGKTTTIRLLNGVLAPSDGSALVLGFDPVSDGPSLRRHTGILTETPSLDERLTARENLQIYAELYDVPRQEVATRIDEFLERFELTERADEKAGNYSKGMKQRLALARAMLHKPELLFFDEPTSGLDPVAARQVHRLIVHLSRDEARTVFLCTHNLAEAQRLCDRVAVLEHGRVVALGTPAELADHLGRSQRLSVDVAPEAVSTALEVLARLGYMHQEADPENGTIDLVGVGRESIPDLIASLVASHVRLYGVRPQEPSLEDVYFLLQGQQTTDASGVGEEL